MGDGKEWFDGLRANIVNCRQQIPIPPREQLSEDDEWECRIVGGSLIQWLKQVGPSLLEERVVLHKLLEIVPDPYLIFTSNMPGLVAAQEIVGDANERIVYLLEREFEDWQAHDSDDSYKWHVHFWSAFQVAIEPEFQKKAIQKYPSGDKGAFRQHSEGTMWAVRAGRGVDHLWKWQIGAPELLEEAFSSWVA